MEKIHIKKSPALQLVTGITFYVSGLPTHTEEKHPNWDYLVLVQCLKVPAQPGLAQYEDDWEEIRSNFCNNIKFLVLTADIVI